MVTVTITALLFMAGFWLLSYAWWWSTWEYDDDPVVTGRDITDFIGDISSWVRSERRPAAETGQ